MVMASVAEIVDAVTMVTDVSVLTLGHVAVLLELVQR